MNIEVTVKAPYFLDVGVHTSYLAVENSGKRITIPITYTISDLPLPDPEITYVSPYVAREGVASDVALRGHGFDQLDAGTLPAIHVGSAPATNVEIISDSHISMTVPGLSEGIHPVTLSGKLSGSDVDFPGTVDLHVIPDQTFQSVDIASAGEKSRIIFDNQRSALYVVNPTVGVLERYRFDSGTNWEFDQLYLAGVSDAALAPDGRTLVLVDGIRFYEVELGTNSMTLGDQGDVELGIDYSLDHVEAGSNGVIYGVSNDQRSPIFTYDLDSGKTGTLQFRTSQGTLVNYSSFQPNLFSSPNGIEIFLGERNITTSRLYRLTTGENIPSETGLIRGTIGFRSATFSPDGSLILINGEELYDENLDLLSSLPLSHTSSTFSPDGSIAYTFTRFNGTESYLLSKYDLSDPAAPQQIGETISLADGPRGALGLAISNDGNTLFLAGDEKVLIVDLTSLTF
ncbi:IPT/TIG domain-containing protein [Marinobacter sp. 71-i]|uniref:IPT/TIG domain-containing protein n=1 Tax=Marinobacter iranensis TaxID=2962607 RepID=A0ABT5YAK3_9GAMM|nr:IPT/TIG domain-containing protein [Marinobacter iranensis]MDF0750707.1 IPT/TIG domain-containing protein [Marinobacter iranensis]